jgi:hypothetical protein
MKNNSTFQINERCLWFFRINLLLIVASLLLDFKIAGFTVLGYLWVLMLIYSLITIVINRSVSFPYLVWLPFTLYLGGWVVIEFSFLGLQQTLQYFVPIIAGMAASGFIYSDQTLFRILQYFRRFGMFLILYSIIYPLIMGKEFIAGAHLVMTVTLTVTVLFSVYLFSKTKRDLFLSVILLLVPFLTTLRMGMLMTLLVIPLNFARMGFRARFFIGSMILLTGLFIFTSSRFQRKMFFSGRGQLTDLSFDNPNFYTSGRKTLYALLEDGIKDRPILGNGPRAELQVFRKAGLQIKETHNDFKAIRYNYGLVGLILLIISLILTFISVYRTKFPPGRTSLKNLYRSVSLTLFIPFLGYMYTDNILKYTIFFGTLHFAFIAILFSRVRQTSES